jgi:hypothetical protein
MYIFLSRLGRLVVGIPVIVAITTILGLTTITAVPVASRHAASASACAVSSAGVGQQLVVSGHGFAAGTQYHLFVSSPYGSWETVANTDASGAFTYDTWAYMKGAYGANVWTEGGGSKQVAACTTLSL